MTTIRNHGAAMVLTFIAAFAIGYGLLVLAPPHAIRAAIAGSDTANPAGLTPSSRPTTETAPVVERDVYGAPVRENVLALWYGLHRAIAKEGEAARLRFEHAALRELREMAHDPGTFSLVSVDRMKTFVDLCVTFRSMNALGVLQRSRTFLALGEWSFPGDVLFEKRWSEYCIKPVRDRELEKARHDNEVAKAERAYLARPERIEELAAKAGLPPIEPDQYKAPPSK